MYIDDKKAVVFVPKDEYEKMKELANANAGEIEKRALEMWETKAIPWLKVSMEIRSSGGRDILDSAEFELRTDSYLVNPSGKFTIKEEQVYDLKAIPTLYLLDKDKTVLLKDATAPAIEAYLMQHQ